MAASTAASVALVKGTTSLPVKRSRICTAVVLLPLVPGAGPTLGLWADAPGAAAGPMLGVLADAPGAGAGPMLAL